MVPSSDPGGREASWTASGCGAAGLIPPMCWLLCRGWRCQANLGRSGGGKVRELHDAGDSQHPQVGVPCARRSFTRRPFTSVRLRWCVARDSILAGLAVGVSGSASGVGILIALLIHKVSATAMLPVAAVSHSRHVGAGADAGAGAGVQQLFEALVMGVSTVKANQALGTRAAEIVVYVLATPLGVLIGLIVSGA